MAVQLLPLAFSLAPAAAQFGQSLIQNNKAKKLKPSDYIPSGIKEAETTARQIAQATQMPGQDRFEARVGKATANTVEAARRSTNSPTALLEAVQESDSRAKGAISNNKANLDSFKLDGQKILSNALVRKGMAQQRNRDAYNAAKSALTGASQQNLYNAITNTANVGVAGSGGVFGEGGATPAAGMDNSGTTNPASMTTQKRALEEFKKLIASGMATPEQTKMYNQLLAGTLQMN